MPRGKTRFFATGAEIHERRCGMCNKLFPSKRFLDLHAKVSHGIEIRRPTITGFICAVCNDSFESKVRLRSHMKSFHNSRF